MIYAWYVNRLHGALAALEAAGGGQPSALSAEWGWAQAVAQRGYPLDAAGLSAARRGRPGGSARAAENLALGILPPCSGAFRNEVQGQMLDETDLFWGLALPGAPEEAAKQAYRAAQAVYCGQALTAHAMTNAMLSAAFASSGTETVIRAALSAAGQDEPCRQAAELALRLKDEEPHLAARQLWQRFGDPDRGYAPLNVALIVYALCCGEDDILREGKWRYCHAVTAAVRAVAEGRGEVSSERLRWLAQAAASVAVGCGLVTEAPEGHPLAPKPAASGIALSVQWDRSPALTADAPKTVGAVAENRTRMKMEAELTVETPQGFYAVPERCRVTLPAGGRGKALFALHRLPTCTHLPAANRFKLRSVSRSTSPALSCGLAGRYCYRVLGPFPSEDEAKQLPPPAAFNAGVRLYGGELLPDEVTAMRGAYTLYAETAVYVPGSVSVRLHVDGDMAFTLWQGDRQLICGEGGVYAEDMAVCEVTLSGGEEHFYLKCRRTCPGQSISLRFTRADGSPADVAAAILS